MLFLSGAELATLTGRITSAAQVRWLETHHWIYDIGADGKPKVALAYFERRMVYGEEKRTDNAQEDEGKKEWEINVEALRPNTSIS